MTHAPFKSKMEGTHHQAPIRVAAPGGDGSGKLGQQHSRLLASGFPALFDLAQQRRIAGGPLLYGLRRDP